MIGANRNMPVEIISVDSAQVYRGMDIGTAKPTPAERSVVPHQLIDVLDPWESGNVAWWLNEAGRWGRKREVRGGRVGERRGERVGNSHAIT